MKREKITESHLMKLIEQEVDNYTQSHNIYNQQKNIKIEDVISNIYQMIMKGQIEAAKKALADDPKIQAMASEVAKLTSELGKKLRTDDKFLNSISKMIDKM